MQHTVPGLLPIPREERCKIGDWVIGNPGEHVGEPNLRINIIELGSLDQCVHGRGAFAATLRAGEELGFTTQCDAAQRTLCRIVAKADASIVEEAHEGGPAL
jgi:hypothetical protein